MPILASIEKRIRESLESRILSYGEYKEFEKHLGIKHHKYVKVEYLNENEVQMTCTKCRWDMIDIDRYKLRRKR